MDDFEDLLHIDWGEAHRGFVHADELGSAAVQWAGAATEARAHDMPLAPPAKKTAAEMAITATKLLGVSAATKVNPAIATRPTMIGSLRELIGENPPAISLSVIQPAPMLPTTPQA